MPKFGKKTKLVRLEMEGRTVTAAIRIRHRDGSFTVEPCNGEWMGKRIKVPATAIAHMETSAVEAAYRLDAERQSQS